MSSFDQLLDLDPDPATPQARTELLNELVKLERWAQARQQQVLAAIAVDPDGIGVTPAARAAAADKPGRTLDEKHYEYDALALALQIAYPSVPDRLFTALTLVQRLPDTLAALNDGAIGLPHCRRLIERAAHLPNEKLAEVEARVLPRAGQQSVGQFSQAVRRAVLSVEEPADQAERIADAIAERRVCATAHDNGTGELWTQLAITDLHAIMARLNTHAEQLKALGDGRTADQRRADAVVDLLLGTDAPTLTSRSDSSRAGQAPHIQVTVALSTLLALDNQPAELVGTGPIPAALARQLAADPTGTWRRLLTDDTGMLLDYGRTTYRPPARLADFVATKQHSCRMAGCTRPAVHCEIDHRHAWAEGGTTSEANLWPLCTRHHHLKHDAGWHCELRDDGTAGWITPTGHTYLDPPPQLPIDRTISTADNDPPPF